MRGNSGALLFALFIWSEGPLLISFSIPYSCLPFQYFLFQFYKKPERAPVFLCKGTFFLLWVEI